MPLFLISEIQTFFKIPKHLKSLTNILYKGTSMSVHQHSQLKHSCTKWLSEVQLSLKSLFHMLFIYQVVIAIFTLSSWMKSVQPSGSLRSNNYTTGSHLPVLKYLQKLFALSLLYQYRMVCLYKMMVDFVQHVN